MNQQPDPAQIQHMMTVMAPLIAGFALAGLALLIIPYWQIFKKAGFPAWLGLFMFIPLINIILLYVLAFSRWKVIPAPDYAGFQPPYPPPGYGPPPGYAPPAGYVPAASGTPLGYVPPNTPPAV